MKEWIFFGVGVALGSGVTFLAVKKHYRDIAFHEISEMRAFYREKKAELEAKVTQVTQKTDENEDENRENEEFNEALKAKISPILDRYSGKNRDEVAQITKDKERKIGEKRVENHGEWDVDDRFFEDDGDDPYDIFVSHEAPSEGYAEQPYRITEEEFSSERLYYDKVLIDYYADGIAVIEETDEVLDSLEDQIGPYILGQPIEEDTIYVRNEARSSDYCITLKETNFVSEEGSD